MIAILSPRVVVALPVVLAVALLAGCGSFLSGGAKGSAADYYMLHHLPLPTGQERPGGASAPQVVMILEPSLPGALATDGIAVRIGAYRIAYLTGARWSDETPLLLARLIRQAVDSLPHVVAISEDEVGIVPQWRLVSELDTFFAEAADSTSPPERVHVELTARLLAARPGNLFAERHFSAEAKIAGSGNDAIVGAFDTATNRVIIALRSWLAQELTVAARPQTGG